MKEGKIAVIGDSDVVQVFKAIGMDVFPIATKEEAEEKIKKIEKEYAVIYMTENFVLELNETLKRYEQKAYPIIVSIPSVKSNTGYGLQRIRDNVEKAVGLDILDN